MHLTVLGEWQGNQGYLASIPMFLKCEDDIGGNFMLSCTFSFLLLIMEIFKDIKE